ncbi:hypothetical protein SESBI_34200 [Sesbania bispinosa]|nr:hypothetical protein SESBI_34200 [Sesbania bispinosa]
MLKWMTQWWHATCRIVGEGDQICGAVEEVTRSAEESTGSAEEGKCWTEASVD